MGTPSDTPRRSSPGEVPERRNRLILLAVSIGVALLLAEFVLRVYSPQIGKLRQLVVATDDDRGFAPRPNIRIPFDGVFSRLHQTVLWQTNADGLRHQGPVAERGEHFRVAAYGDSETFGWAVALEETFQHQMELLDPRVEVLNLGVPGYNVNNVRDHLEQTVPRYRPDLAIYLVNKNDFNEPFTLSNLSRSHLLLHLRFLVHFTIGKEIRRARRDGEDRTQNFAREVDRMTRFLEERDTPFLVGFLKWKNHESLNDYVSESTGASRANENGSGDGNEIGTRFRFGIVNVKEVVKGEPKEDTHYAQSAHRKMAALFCREISGEDGGSCVPPQWRRTAQGHAARGEFAKAGR